MIKVKVFVLCTIDILRRLQVIPLSTAQLLQARVME